MTKAGKVNLFNILIFIISIIEFVTLVLAFIITYSISGDPISKDFSDELLSLAAPLGFCMVFYSVIYLISNLVLQVFSVIGLIYGIIIYKSDKNNNTLKTQKKVKRKIKINIIESCFYILLIMEAVGTEVLAFVTKVASVGVHFFIYFSIFLSIILLFLLIVSVLRIIETITLKRRLYE